MSEATLLFPVLIPAAAAVCVLLLPKADKWVKALFALIATAANLALSIAFMGRELSFSLPWGGFGIDLQLRLYEFSAFIALAANAFGFLIALYSSVFMKDRPFPRMFWAFFLLTVSFVNGAVLANNLVVLLFFWEGLGATLFAMILSGGRKASPTAVKALVLNGAADLCLMLGIALTAHIAGTLQIDRIKELPVEGLGAAAFALMMTGAVAKAGSMPFHSWIPDAAKDAPLPFMAFLPGAIEKLLGIYLLARISMDLFHLEPHSPMSVAMMALGAVTLLLAVMMALVQKDYKRLLSYHAISQVGYMILGVGTALPVGIVGGLFHMVNNAIFKSGLFLTAGAVEKQTGTTDLHDLGGLGRRMPVTFVCFLVMALSISGVPFFNGFYSKELIFDGAWEAGPIFYIVAAIGAFCTAASFLKLGHAAWFGKPGKAAGKAKEAPWPMLLPMIALAAGCVVFGLGNAIPLDRLIQPALPERLLGEAQASFAGIVPHSGPGWFIAGVSVFVLAMAVLNHIIGVKAGGSGLNAVDHIHYAPGLRQIYKAAEKGWFDPYELGMKAVNGFSKLLFWIDRGIDWVFNNCFAWAANGLSWLIRKPHNGTHWMYILWVLGGTVALGVLFLGVF